MQLVNEFVVPRPIDEAWAVLTDVPRIAPCMPGATLGDEVDGGYEGKVKIKVGPVTAAYGGIAKFRELDPAAHHMVLDASGKEASGRGRASAVVTADLTAEGSETRVRVVTDLTISGPLAQFGRGAIAEVSNRLLTQFVNCLRDTVLNSPSASSAESAAAATSGQSTAGSASAQSGTSAQSSASAQPAADDRADHDLVSGPYAPDVPPVAPAVSPSNPLGPSAPTIGLAPTSPGRNAPAAAAPPAEMNLLKVAGWPILKRVLPVVIVVVVVVVLLVWWLG